MNQILSAAFRAVGSFFIQCAQIKNISSCNSPAYKSGYPRHNQTEGYSLEAQKERLRQFAEYKDLEISGEYCDAGRSGHSIKGRPSFMEMLDDITAEKDGISFVLVYKLSRFGRNAADVLKSMQLPTYL